MNRLVGVVDYGLGNLQSIVGAVKRVGMRSLVSSKANELIDADNLILPGVGAYGDGMQRLKVLGLVDVLAEIVLVHKKPILGICLGYQLMAREGSEFGRHQGLGWFDAVVVPLESKAPLRLPHVGWNDMEQRRRSVLFEGIPADALFYYVHSYCVKHEDDCDTMGACKYGTRFSAVAQKGNIFGVQFHPEKSQKWGLHMMRNFLEID